MAGMGMFDTENEVVDAAAEHILDAAIADGNFSTAKPEPTDFSDQPPVNVAGLEPGIVGSAEEYIEEAAIADGRVQ